MKGGGGHVEGKGLCAGGRLRSETGGHKRRGGAVVGGGTGCGGEPTGLKRFYKDRRPQGTNLAVVGGSFD